MKIADVEAIHLRIPDVEEIADGTQDVLLVRIVTDDGIEGIGEVTSQSYVCKAIVEAASSAERRHGLRHILVGQEIDDVERLWNHMYYHTNRFGRRGAAIHAISGADMAIWDIVGKAANKPVYELWGGQRRPIRAYASYLFGESPGDTAELARVAVDLGLTAAKFGWGPFGRDVQHDLDQVGAAREALGDDRDLMVYVGCKWDAATAIDRAKRLAQYNIAWLEEPLSQDDLAGYSELCENAAVPIAAGEGDVTRYDFQNLIQCGVDVVQPDVAFCGGLTVCRQVSDLCRQFDRRFVPHCFSTGVNLAGSLHWAVACGGDLVEYCLRPSPLMRELVSNLPQLEDGHVTVSDGPGLGIELDLDVLNRFRV